MEGKSIKERMAMWEKQKEKDGQTRQERIKSMPGGAPKKKVAPGLETLKKEVAKANAEVAMGGDDDEKDKEEDDKKDDEPPKPKGRVSALAAQLGGKIALPGMGAGPPRGLRRATVAASPARNEGGPRALPGLSRNTPPRGMMPLPGMARPPIASTPEESSPKESEETSNPTELSHDVVLDRPTPPRRRKRGKKETPASSEKEADKDALETVTITVDPGSLGLHVVKPEKDQPARIESIHPERESTPDVYFVAGDEIIEIAGEDVQNLTEDELKEKIQKVQQRPEGSDENKKVEYVLRRATSKK